MLPGDAIQILSLECMCSFWMGHAIRRSVLPEDACTGSRCSELQHEHEIRNERL